MPTSESPVAYLNHAAGSWPKPPGVAEAVLAALQSPPDDPGRATAGDASDEVAGACRRALAGLLGAPDPARIVLTANTTAALNLAILGLGPRLRRVVSSVVEHNSVLRPLVRLREQGRIRLDLVGLDPCGALDREAFRRSLREPTDLVVLTHASNVTGRINPVGELFAEAKAAGAVTLLDAAQTLGYLSVRPAELSADLVAFPGHKGLWGPPGTGGLYVGPGIELEQVVVGGTGVRSEAPAHPSEMPLRLEAGTPNAPALAGLRAALAWLTPRREALEGRARSASVRLRTGLAALPAVRLVDDDETAPRVGVTALRLAGWDVGEAAFVLRRSFGVVCRSGLHCAPGAHAALGTAPQGTIRLSVAGTTSEAEVDAALAALRGMAA